ncbi:MAG TPA: hypothetical protein VMJ75_18585 [Candidatus Acidoferrales bacterium]|nr:hypothetical protein [Candidatus Acidoferrales bacterium]HXK04991.1 hypothetical protein [Verrucomicrobiae bacterium]
MPGVATPPETGRGLASSERIAEGARENLSNGAGRASRPRRLLRDLFRGLNALLKLSDFSRGDIFRD